MKIVWLALLGVGLLGTASAQQAPPAPAPLTATPPRTKDVDSSEIARINAWTVGLAAGEREGAPLQFATDIARVADDGDNMHVLPIVTHGPTDNVADLLYLKGVDVAIINSDSLAQFQTKIPDIQQRISYVLSLFPSELHIMARPEIKTLDDLRGKKVNFNTIGTAAAYSGPLMFDKLKIDGVQRTFIPHQVAIEQMKAGTNDMAAVVFVTSKPVDAFLKGKWPEGFHFLSVSMHDYSTYLPATLTAADYPAFIPQGTDIQTIAIPTFLATFNWPKGSNRYARVERLVDNLFSRLEVLQGQGFHPKWKDVVLNAQVPGLSRFRPAQEWLDKTTTMAQTQPPATPVATPVTSSADPKLWEEFLHWRQANHQ